MRIYTRLILVYLLCGSSILSSTAPPKKPQAKVLIQGIDHIPIIVSDPDSVAVIYKKLGFAIKPGRSHQNSIRNQHIKFPDGTELELITASQPTDELSTEYYNWLKTGEGPLYFGLYSNDISALAKQLDGFRQYETEGNSITFPTTDVLHPLFFGSRNLSPSDKPAHFAHANTATSLIGLWIATDSIATYLTLFKRLNIPLVYRKMNTPVGNVDVQVATLAQGEIILLPKSFKKIPGHQVIGATVSVADITAVQQQLDQTGIKAERKAKSIYIEPAITHGIWLEFRQK
ncbi:VOC family protein [Chitinophaga sp. Hz27]|uniref:VOC family protein n=1 Tax=Chitinophaga sp. Hz27 TaxID=3347169 RepID=UPI0035E25CA1